MLTPRVLQSMLLGSVVVTTVRAIHADLAPLRSREVEQRQWREQAFEWGVTPMRGVNIGGWLVLEVSPFRAMSDQGI